MKQIIVPIDFSDNAYIAAEFALALSLNLKTDFALVHAYQSFRSGFQSASTNFQDEDRARNEAEEEMEIFIKKLQDKTGEGPLQGTCIQGTLLSVINLIKHEEDRTIIVMGTKGASGIKYHLIGSNTLYVAKNSSLPIITVPGTINQYKIKKIAIFTDYKIEDKKNLDHIISIFGTTEVTYKLFHIHEEITSALPSDIEKLIKWTEMLKTSCGLTNLLYEFVEGAENAKMVNEISRREDIDLITLTMTGQNFWESLFEKNLAKAIVLQGITPVFIQH